MLNAAEKKRLKLLQARIEAAQLGGAAVELTADDERFLNAVALKSAQRNVRAKAFSGKTLTTREARMLESGDADAPAGVFVQNWNDLADAIPIDRRTLQNFREDNAQLIADEKKDLFRADGRKCVPKWRELLAACGVRGRGANNPDVNSLDARQLDLEERRFKLETAKHKFEREKDALLPVAQFERAWMKTHAALLAAMNAFGARVNENLEGLDFDERADVIDREIEQLRKTIAACDYLTPEEVEDGG